MRLTDKQKINYEFTVVKTFKKIQPKEDVKSG